MPFTTSNADLTAGVVRIHTLAQADLAADYTSESPFVVQVNGAATVVVRPWRDTADHSLTFTAAGSINVAGALVLCRAIRSTSALGSNSITLGWPRDS